MIHYQDQLVTVHHGDCLDVLRTLPDASVDSVVTDPPYGLEFMGKDWDSFKVDRRQQHTGDLQVADNQFGRAGIRYGVGGSYGGDGLGAMRAFQDWCELWARECLRVLKPGGHILAFGGSRTWHRLAAAIEDAGFEIRDSIAWLYGSGFPKSMNVAKAITGAELGVGSNARAIRKATLGDEYTPSGVRGNRDGVTRRSDTGMVDRDLALSDAAKAWEGWGTALKPAFEPIVVGRKPLAGTVAANVIAHGTGALHIDATRIGDEPRVNQPAGNKPGGASLNMSAVGMPQDVDARAAAGRWPTNVVLDESQAAVLDEQTGVTRSTGGSGDKSGRLAQNVYGEYAGTTKGANAGGLGDVGGASRFFPTFRYEAKAPTFERPRDGEVQHPTVKPLDLMRWLVRLVTPPNGVVLEPFAGSGTTVEAALIEGFRCIAIEREADYLPLIEKRITKPLQQSLFGDWDEEAS